MKSGGERFAVLENNVTEQNGTPQWYAVRVRSRYENNVARHLDARGLDAFLPFYKCQTRWSDRLKEISLPLFPGYVFCRFLSENRLPVLTAPGVVHIVSVGKIPAPIEESEISALQAAVAGGLRREPWPYLQVGQKVTIERGPLAGASGILLGFRGQERLVLSITLLQRSVAVQIEQSWVRPEDAGQPGNWIRSETPAAVSDGKLIVPSISAA